MRPCAFCLLQLLSISFCPWSHRKTALDCFCKAVYFIPLPRNPMLQSCLSWPSSSCHTWRRDDKVLAQTSWRSKAAADRHWTTLPCYVFGQRVWVCLSGCLLVSWPLGSLPVTRSPRSWAWDILDPALNEDFCRRQGSPRLAVIVMSSPHPVVFHLICLLVFTARTCYLFHAIYSLCCCLVPVCLRSRLCDLPACQLFSSTALQAVPHGPPLCLLFVLPTARATPASPAAVPL